MGRARLVVFLVLPVLALSACTVSIGGSDKIDRKKAEKFLKDNIRPAVTSVSCPSGVKEKKGGTFTCSIAFADGKTGTVTVHMTDSSGGVHVSGSDIHVSG